MRHCSNPTTLLAIQKTDIVKTCFSLTQKAQGAHLKDAQGSGANWFFFSIKQYLFTI